MTEPAIRITDLHKTFVLHHRHGGSLKRAVFQTVKSGFRTQDFESKEVLKGISLEIPRGETVAIIGRNGSGKSTLLSLISKVYRATSGQIEVRGKIAPLLELGAGFHPDMTGLENMELYGAILGIPPERLREKASEIIAFAFDTPDMAQKIDTALRNYSDGMKMRLGFSLAIHTEFDILIVDEVLAVGDEAFQHKCFRAIEEFQKAGKTILFVSHDIHVVRQVASRVIWMHRGRIRMDGPTPEVLEAYLAAAGDADFGDSRE